MSVLRDQLDRLSPLQRASLAIKQLRARLDAVEQAQREPVAIIGMACRFPGGANSPDAFWRLLVEGQDAISDVPDGRWDRDAFYDPDPGALGHMYTCKSGFLRHHDTASFDAGFFRLSPTEANGLDPQHRLLFELTWEALEDGGISPDHLVGTRTGVYIGIATNDYAQIAAQIGLEKLDPYVGFGTSMNTAAGRLSFFLGLRGPAMALDTACSSSLVAAHLGCRSLRTKESNLVIVGGVNLILAPVINVFYSRMGALAPDARCKAFDAAADGMVRGEGGAVVVLKRYSDAIRDGDRVLGLIRGSAVNHDGQSSGLTVPNGAAQREVIRTALADGGIEPSEVRYIETHGTGTALGDPIEVNALIAEMGVDRADSIPLILGSSKANVGHLEAASGLVSLLKTVMILRNRQIPPQIHYQDLNPQITPGAFPLVISKEPLSWPDGQRDIAGVSSFGMSGTNAHMLLEAVPTDSLQPVAGRTAAVTSNGVDAIAQDAIEEALGPPPGWLLPISARSDAALRELAQRYQELMAKSEQSPVDICRAAACRRAHLERRVAVTGQTRDEFAEALAAFAIGDDHERCFHGVLRPGQQARVVFVFAGQGNYRAGVGRDLFAAEPVFREAIHACAEAINPP